MAKYCWILAFLFIHTHVFSQTDTHAGWLANFNTTRLGGKWSLHSDFQFRSTDGYAKWQSILLRTGLNYHLNKRSIATIGYAYIPNRAGNAGLYKLMAEHRVWQQFIYNQPLKRTAGLQHRFRFEERWIPQVLNNGNALEKNGDFFATRFRYFFRTIIPWKQQSAAFSHGFFNAVQNEIFLHTSGKEKLNGKTFDQNRMYLALGYRLSPKLDLETGYLWQYTDRKNPAANVNNHVAQLAIYTRL